MYATQFFDGPNFKDVSSQVSAYFAANPGFIGVSLAMQVIGERYQAILMYHT